MLDHQFDMEAQETKMLYCMQSRKQLVLWLDASATVCWRPTKA